MIVLVLVAGAIGGWLIRGAVSSSAYTVTGTLSGTLTMVAELGGSGACLRPDDGSATTCAGVLTSPGNPPLKAGDHVIVAVEQFTHGRSTMNVWVVSEPAPPA